jgi:molybdopterin-guanine dinucleotide biosynthesis protein A
MRDAIVVVLAGGKSSRMGRPKSLLLFDGERLIVHIVRALKRIFAETVIVAAPDQELPDRQPWCGTKSPIRGPWGASIMD